MRIRTGPLLDITVARFQRMVQVVDLSPPYQREGGVWKRETRARLIDSILNGLDVPKLYFERVSTRRLTAEGFSLQYSVIDGKQRLEAVLDFLAGDLRLPEDFIYFEDDSVKPANMSLVELEAAYPGVARRFYDYELPIIHVTSDSGDLIEEMFQRLNASSALNAAERRNALSGPTRTAANALAEHVLLIERSPIKNARYKYRELAAKFLAIEHQLATKNRIIDTKSDTLYDLFAASRDPAPTIDEPTIEGYRRAAEGTLSRMAAVFEDSDPLLASIGTVVVLYIVYRDLSLAAADDREKLAEFEALRREASRMSEDDEAYASPANARLREYNVFVQSTNDGRALARRAQILSAYLSDYEVSNPLGGLDDVPEGELPEHDDAES